MGFPGGASGKAPACFCRGHKRYGFNAWVGKTPWRRAWQPTPVILAGKSHGQRNLAGWSQWGHKESDTTEETQQRAHRVSFRGAHWSLKSPGTLQNGSQHSYKAQCCITSYNITSYNLLDLTTERLWQAARGPKH